MTADKGHYAGENFPEVHHIFEDILRSRGKDIARQIIGLEGITVQR